MGLTPELPEESKQFRFFRASCSSNLKGCVGLILDKTSAMWVTIPIDLSTWSFIPLPHFFNSRRVPPLLNQSLVLIPQQSPYETHDVSYIENFIGQINGNTLLRCSDVIRSTDSYASELGST